MGCESLDRSTAERIVENLRYGIPPEQHIICFTVGREDQLRLLSSTLSGSCLDCGAALLVKANYGAGKSHLLKVIRELALQSGYAVSDVTVDALGGVRFNLMDTILSAVCRRITVPDLTNGANAKKCYSGPGGLCLETCVRSSGIGALFDAYASPVAPLPDGAIRARERISNGGRWDHSEYLSSPGLYVALRAWINSSGGTLHDLINDWLCNVRYYGTQRRRMLYEALVMGLRDKFRDRRPEWMFYADGVFVFNTDGHRQAWGALADLHTLAKLAGLKGMVLLFDEFEDVLQNLANRNYKEQAFYNLFRFFDGERYPGMAYFAVTPDFAHKCKLELLRKGIYNFSFEQFGQLKAFELEPITQSQVMLLAGRLRAVHERAYGWESSSAFPGIDVARIVVREWDSASPDRVRRIVQSIVRGLDDAYKRAG